MDELAEMRALLASQPKPVCAQLLKAVLLAVDSAEGFVRVEFEEQPIFSNHFNNIAGGFLVAQLDAVISIAAFAMLRKWLPTIEIKTHRR